MSYKLIVRDKALAELNDAYDWYEEQSLGLGDDFVSEIEKCYHKLIANPTHYPFLYPKDRRIKTNRFPYVLIFRIIEDEVIVLRVRHDRQKPL